MSSKDAEALPDTGESGSSTPKLNQAESKPSSLARVSAYLDREIDSKAADLISIYACFLTGFTSSHSFTVRHTPLVSNTGAQMPGLTLGMLYLVRIPDW